MSDPIQSAYEAFEAARLIYDAKYEYADQVYREISALPVEPRRTWASDETLAQQTQWTWWQSQRRRRTEARLGTNEEAYINPYRDRMDRAESALADIEATSLDELLCQVRAWWRVNEDLEEDQDDDEAYLP